MENKIYIIGCGGHARSVADIILGNVPSAQLIFVDENARDKETIFDFPVIKSLPQEAQNIFIAIGDNQKRREISSGRKLISVIAKTAYVAPTAVIEDGCFIASGVHVGPFVHIGKGTLINTNAVVEHEVQVGEFCHLAPNTTVCGRMTIGDRVFWVRELPLSIKFVFAPMLRSVPAVLLSKIFMKRGRISAFLLNERRM